MSYVNVLGTAKALGGGYDPGKAAPSPESHKPLRNFFLDCRLLARLIFGYVDFFRAHIVARYTRYFVALRIVAGWSCLPGLLRFESCDACHTDSGLSSARSDAIRI